MGTAALELKIDTDIVTRRLLKMVARIAMAPNRKLTVVQVPQPAVCFCLLRCYLY